MICHFGKNQCWSPDSITITVWVRTLVQVFQRLFAKSIHLWVINVYIDCKTEMILVCSGFSVPPKNFQSFEDVTIADEGLQILTYAWHSWPLSSEGYLTCHIYCDTGQPFIMVISEDPWHSHLLPSVWQWNFHYLFQRSLACEANTLP